MKFISILFPICALVLGCQKKKPIPQSYESDQIKIERLTENAFRHISYLNTESWGKVACNGMIIIDGDEALVFDTPPDNPSSKELINWIEEELDKKIMGVVATHFHDDCLGGLAEFHLNGIASYAHHKTIELAKAEGLVFPKNGFPDFFELPVGSTGVINVRLGEGHTQDNIIGYFPDEKVLFGGCLIKGIGASKGYLGDANIGEWSKTVEKIKSSYPEAEVIIPGHGKAGGQELLDYTIELFQEN